MLWELLMLLVVISIIIVIFMVLKNVFILILNSVIGFFALYAVQAWVMPSLEINFWSVMITAIGGIIGFIVVVGSHLLGWAF